jgi:hypothetical protein
MSAVGLAPVEPVAIFGVKLIAEQAHAVHAETIASARRKALHALCNSVLYAWGEGHGVVGQVNRDDELHFGRASSQGRATNCTTSWHELEGATVDDRPECEDISCVVIVSALSKNRTARIEASKALGCDHCPWQTFA